MVQRATRVDAGVPPVADDLAELNRIAARAVTQSTAENFPVALRVLPRRVRDQLTRVYCYARFVDDVGDGATGDRLKLLARIDRDLSALADGESTLEAVRQLRPLLETTSLTIEPFHNLIEANRLDQTRHEYETFDELMAYCQLSAAPIGRIALGLAGVTDRLMQRRSDHVCAALQILEHCQDVREDAKAGRIYLPADDRRAAGVTNEQLLRPHTSPAVRQVVSEQVARAQRLLLDGAPLTKHLHGWARLAVTGYVAGGRATARALAAHDYDVLARHIGPGKVRTAGYAALIAVGR